MGRTPADRAGTGSSLQLERPGARERVEALIRQMSDREHWPRERLLEFQHGRLRQTIELAVAGSTYYRKAIGGASGRDINLQRLPVLTKEALTTEFDRIVTDPRLRLVEAEQHLAGDQAGELLFDEYRVVASGGTTGQRGVLVYDQPAWEAAIAGFMRVLGVPDIPAHARVLGIGAPTPFHMSNRLFAELRTGRMGAPRLAVTTPLADVIDALNAYQPEAVITYPSFIRTLAQEQRAGRLRMSPRTFVSVAETLTPSVRELVQDTWRTPVLDCYCTTEAGLMGVECPFTTGLHVTEELLVLEVVDDRYQPVPAGVTGHKVLLTTLFNRALPLIRYELSDHVTVAEGPCACGRLHLRLAAIEGRREEALNLPARDGGQVTLQATLVGEAILRLPAVRQYQLGPVPGGLAVRVVLADPRLAADTLAAVRSIVQTELDRVGAYPREVRIEAADRIERVGAGAKQRPVSGRP